MRAAFIAWLLALAQGTVLDCHGRPLVGDASSLQRIQQLEARVTVLEGLGDPADARARFERRTQVDVALLGADSVRDLERRYVAANVLPLESQERLDALRVIVGDPMFTGSNRVGCSLLYLGRFGPGDEAEPWLRRAVEDHSDALYGDGVQVGAYARYELAALMRRRGRYSAAASLDADLTKRWPDAVDHAGVPLVDG